MTLGDLLCCRCSAVLPENVAYAADIYGGPVCEACHEAEWNPSTEELKRRLYNYSCSLLIEEKIRVKVVDEPEDA